MRLIFCGTTDFSVAILDGLIAAGHEIALVLTQPDRPAGRGMQLRATPVKRYGQAAGLSVLTPESLKNTEAFEAARTVDADAAVVVAYGLLLPQAFLDLPRLGCLNIHASLLPRWRGAAPICRAILAGDRMTGISIMKMDAGLDTGPVYQKVPVPIAPTDTADRLERKLMEAAVPAICETLAALQTDPNLTAWPQDEVQANYAAKIDKAEAEIDWAGDATVVERQVRGLNPIPGARSTIGDQVVKVHGASLADADIGGARPGEIIDVGEDRLVVACGKGALLLTELQRANSKRLPVADFLRGFPLEIGQAFGRP